jgi:hypothetical protein
MSDKPLRASDVLAHVKDERSTLTRILSVFPGYRGYKEKETQRETDKLIRNVTARKMKEASDSARELYRKSISSSGTSDVSKSLEQLSMKADTICQRIQHATYGYAPLANVIEVNQEELDRLLEFDASIADSIATASQSIIGVGEVMARKEGVLEGIEKANDALVRIEHDLERRREILFGTTGV